MSIEKGSGSPSSSDDEDKLGRMAQQSAQRSTSNSGSSRSAAEAELENELANEKDGRREDRFLFAVALIAIFDIWAMRSVSSWTLPIVVGIVELFFLLIFARRMGVEEIHFWLNQLLPRINFGLRKPDNTKNASAEDKPKQNRGFTTPKE